jgi:uncharacterized cupredoxin-like copper-binding protein
MSPSGPRRGLVALAVLAVVVLSVGSATLAVAVVNSHTATRNRSYGTVTCAAPPLPGQTVEVTLSDAGGSMMGARPMMVTVRTKPGTAAAGQVSFVVHNQGALAHELVLLPLPADGPGTRPTGPDGKIDEAQSLGEASKSCSSEAGDGIAPGATSWKTITLPVGHYELACDEPWHYSAGMFDVLTVN